MPRTKKADANAPAITNTTKKTNSTSSSTKTTAAQMRNYSKEEYRKELFAKASQAMQLLNLQKTETRSYTIYSKENLRSYMQNPFSNENRLRNLSRFLYRVSQPYRRLVNYNAQLVDLTAMNVSPNIDITQDNDTQTILKDYYDTCVEIDKMHLHSEIYKMLVTAWIEDAAYGYIYEDDTGFFIHLLDGEYCKISSINPDGSYNFAFDFSYFKQRKDYLDYWDSEFQKKYNSYDSDSSLKWQELDPERTICIKVGSDDPKLCIPPYIGVFENLIDTIDLQSLVSVKDELSIYKLLVARLEHMQPIEFKGTTTDDTDMIEKSMSNLFKISGGSLVLNDEKQGTTIYRAHMIADMMNAIKPLLGEIEIWMNRHLSYNLSNPAKVKYLETSPWMKNEKKKELIESAQYGVPVKMAVAALDGFSPLEVLRMQFLENDVLSLHNSWIPLQSSYTQSGNNSNDSGGQEKDVTDLTDEGESTRESGKNDM